MFTKFMLFYTHRSIFQIIKLSFHQLPHFHPVDPYFSYIIMGCQHFNSQTTKMTILMPIDLAPAVGIWSWRRWVIGSPTESRPLGIFPAFGCVRADEFEFRRRSFPFVGWWHPRLKFDLFRRHLTLEIVPNIQRKLGVFYVPSSFFRCVENLSVFSSWGGQFAIFDSQLRWKWGITNYQLITNH